LTGASWNVNGNYADTNTYPLIRFRAAIHFVTEERTTNQVIHITDNNNIIYINRYGIGCAKRLKCWIKMYQLLKTIFDPAAKGLLINPFINSSYS